MTVHLTEQQLNAVLRANGPIALETAQHLQDCAPCRTEAQKLQAAIATFRDEVTRQAAQALPALPPLRHTTPRTQHNRLQSLVPATAAGLLAASLLLAAPLFHPHHARPVQAPDQVSSSLTATNASSHPSQVDSTDQELLTEVNQDLATDTPGALQVLSVASTSSHSTPSGQSSQ